MLLFNIYASHGNYFYFNAPFQIITFLAVKFKSEVIILKYQRKIVLENSNQQNMC